MRLGFKWQQMHPAMRYGFVGYCAGIACTVVFCFVLQANDASSNIRVVRESNLAVSSSTDDTLTDPLISVSVGGPNPAPEYAALYQQVSSYITAQENNGLTIASVSFRDINEADGFNINPSQLYDPASLTKVPLAMAYYSLAENDPTVLDQMIMYSGTDDLDANEQVKSSVQLTAGESYTVEALIEHMIRYSDNNAEDMLANHLAAINQLAMLSTLYNDLGVQPNPNNPDYATTQSYSLFLRVLYNATYLNRDYSTQLLKLLSESDFTEGIESGVPNGVLVAQKFGDARIPDEQGVQVGAELQDCGIVYYPDHPYVLCVMTKGQSISLLEQTISGISQIVYRAIEEKYSS